MLVWSYNKYNSPMSLSNFKLFLMMIMVFLWYLAPNMILEVFNKKIFVLFFMTIILLNYSSLFPSILTITSNILFTMFLSLSVFSCSIFSKNVKNFLTHLVPMGSPLNLIFIMVLIELISQLVRPITLGVRLGANLTAGHLLISLLGVSILPLELIVALVQGYVFSLLFNLYFYEFFFSVKAHVILIYKGKKK